MRTPALLADLTRPATMGDAPHHRMLMILGLVVVSIGFQVASPDTAVARLATAGLLAFTLLAILSVAELPGIVERALRAVLALAVAAALAGALLEGVDSGPVSRLGFMAMTIAAPGALAHGLYRELVRKRAITAPMVFAVITVYLLIGVLFGLTYTLLDELSGTRVLVGEHSGHPRDFLYFSIVTMTTTGYGDLAPLSDAARATAISEALIGQIYLVTVVALIVGNLGRGRVRAEARTRS